MKATLGFLKFPVLLMLAASLFFNCSCGGSGGSSSIGSSNSGGNSGGAGGNTGGGNTGGGSTGGSNNITSPTNHTDWEYIGAKVDAGSQNSVPIPRFAFDRVNKQIFVSVTNLNQVFVADATTHRKKTSIPVPSPTGLDISPDGTKLYVGSFTNFLFVIDPLTLQIKEEINTAKIGYGGFAVLAPIVLNDGRLFLSLGYGVDGADQFIVWSPSTNASEIFDASPDMHGFTGAVANASRSKVIVTAVGSLQMWDVQTEQFKNVHPPNTSIIARAIANPAKDQVAVSDRAGVVSILDSTGSVIATPNVGPSGVPVAGFDGFAFSSDGTRFYVVTESLIRAFDTVQFQQVGAGTQPFSSGAFADPLPFAADTETLYGINEDGLACIDVSGISHNGVAGLPPSYGIGAAYFVPNTGPLGGGTKLFTTLNWGSIVSPPTYLTPYVGGRSAANVHYETPQTTATHIDFTVPPGSTSGPAHILLQLLDGTAQLFPLAFSYGPSILQLSSTFSTSDGGATGFLTGYGFGDSVGDVQLTVNGAPATVTAVQAQPAGMDIPYPTPVRGLAYTIPPGTVGPADITVTTSSGSASLKQALQYIDPGILHPSSSSMQAGVYDAQRHRIYFSAKDHIEVLSVPKGDWQTPISVPNAATSQLVGISISQSGDTVAVADQGNRAIVVFHPDTPSDVRAFAVSDGGLGFQPSGITVTDHGLIYFALSVPWGQNGLGCQHNLWQLDSGTGLSKDLTPQYPWCFDPHNRLLAASDGSRLYIDAEGMLKLYSPDSGFLEFVELADLHSDMALSKDDSRLIQQLTVITQEGDVVGTTLETETEASDTFDLRYGEKLDRHGALMLQPWSTALDINDLGTLRVRQRIALNRQVQNVFDSLVWDDDDDRAFLIVNGGVLELAVQLPLVLSSTSPAALPVGGGAVNLLGNGFTPDTTLTLDGQSLPVLFSDKNTLILQAPAHAGGSVRIKLTRGDGQTSFLDVPLYGTNSIAPQLRRQALSKKALSHGLDLRTMQQSRSHSH